MENNIVYILMIRKKKKEKNWNVNSWTFYRRYSKRDILKNS